MFTEYDIIVVGAGHAGCEAATAAANMGSKVLLVTMNMNTIAQMSCNPAMGGVAKGQIVREIDALGGQSGIITDKSMIQFRMLNLSKGPAMWSPRAQSDRMRFAEEWRLTLEQTPNLDMYQEMVTGLDITNGKVTGIVTGLGIKIKSKAVILTNGTFLNGIIHIGEKQFGGGRAAERPSIGITSQLNELGFVSGRMKTGTPPRVDGRSLDYSKMEEQKGDENPGKFSFLNTNTRFKQRSCFTSYTNNDVHETLKEGFEKSPMFTGRIQGSGPRYCPSIEDKINRFADRNRHQLFIEPEGWNTVEMYINGFSSSLPENIQYKALKLVPGFENVKIYRPGYAIEYDFFQPTQLKNTLETKLQENLYFAGQINGTTGYEEAAAQGLMAGINAHLKLNMKETFVLKRSEAYIGVLIDDLINKGTEEPYRMFTSRAEFRILLRQDNADLRLTEKGYTIGLAKENRLEKMAIKRVNTKKLINEASKYKMKPNYINPKLISHNMPPVKDTTTVDKLIKRPDIYLKTFETLDQGFFPILNQYTSEVQSQAEIQIKYEHYIKREKELADKMMNLDQINIPQHFNYQNMQALSKEAREKLSKILPQNLGQASRISGISPADISILMVSISKR